MDSVEQLRLFLEPRAVAIIGAPRHTGRGSFNIVENLQERGFSGRICPVNPAADTIAGVKAYPDIGSLPAGIDLSIIMLSREVVPQAVKDCIEKGVRALIVVSEGFAEADERGKELEKEVVQIARSGGARVIGPNSLGVVNNFSNFSSSFSPMPLEKTPVALVCQSGGFMTGFSGFTSGKSIDLGNMCDIDFADVLEYLENDPDIQVIALHMEGVKEGQRFREIAHRVNRKKPVMVLKTGRGKRAARAAASHTGSLAGKSQVYRAAFIQSGLTPVDNVDELGDICKVFLHLPPLRGNRIAILTPSGAGAIMALDALEQHHFELARLSENTARSLEHLFPPWSRPLNPIDMMAAGVKHGYKKVYLASLEALLEDDNVDAVLCIAGVPTLKTIQGVARGKGKPVVTWVLGEWGEELLSRVKETGYQAVYPTPERAVRALSALRDYYRDRSPSPFPSPLMGEGKEYSPPGGR